ncbi:hypothetical protein NIES21_43700 [Anabaenopsis circularis NIES-21]|uniref:Uncharacterized protein n=2 Tax=Nostocales TaxID=1161 RepID=A0A1Z4GM02_9CYAN|nr:hypothetical protein [Nostoc cycadae]BAY18523.1 hypothetical protein NIES21_43700 [Anabaenopsis circularis NIES-21]GBE90425.1 hypothetical protein NCWK1_0141 [Nostoc cycadae WK-1]
MKHFNHFVTVAESTAPVIYARFFWAISGCKANLVPINKSNNRYVEKKNFSLNKFLTNRQLTQDETPSTNIQASTAIKLSVYRLVSNRLTYGGEMLVGSADTETCTARTNFNITAESVNC